ncbi:cytochrome c oxidase subunit II [Synechococcus sp. HK05]|uniref:cytochrome c oxidase subunit II n=1 Tax=Synechococcus sp. HK05 TaxID=2725975 RepID=UPI001C386430|nr:cytochrome c oxidase subunit II [Synechococcus sp. HK05]MBV2351599.1 cytochrome c oxidase subunit II [Synechococcus sp. HK05]
MRVPPSILTLLTGMALVLAGLWIGQNVNLLPTDASANAPVYDELFKVLFSIGAILFIGIVGLIVYSLVRFRRRVGETGDGAAIEGNLPLEIVWTAIPAVVVLFVGIYSYDIYDRMGGMTPLNDHSMHGMQHSDERTWGGISPVALEGDGAIAALPVDVTAMQFAFIFHYPDSDITSGELHVPVGQPVALQMKALDVIHAFWVPQFRLKQDVIPGQPTLLSFTPTRAGQYPIVCAELCGPYHGGMRSTVVVEEPESFAAWVAKNSPNPPAESPAAVQS